MRAALARLSIGSFRCYNREPMLRSKDAESEALMQLRKIEKQAKQLIFKMKRLEKDWSKTRASIKSPNRSLPKTLGDVLSGWSKINQYE